MPSTHWTLAELETLRDMRGWIPDSMKDYNKRSLTINVRWTDDIPSTRVLPPDAEGVYIIACPSGHLVTLWDNPEGCRLLVKLLKTYSNTHHDPISRMIRGVRDFNITRKEAAKPKPVFKALSLSDLGL